MTQLRLLLRAMRWRAGAVVSLLVVATIAVMAATAGPLYFGTALGSVLHSTLESGSAQVNGITVIPQVYSGARPLRQSAARDVTQAGSYGLDHWYLPPVTTLDLGTETPKASPYGKYYQADLLARTGVCAHLKFISGSCPTAKDEVAITARSARILGVAVGSSIPLLGLNSAAPTSVRVSGVVAVSGRSNPYWFGENYFTFGPPPPASLEGPKPIPRLDALFTPASTLAGYSPAITLQFPLRVNRVTVSNAGELHSAYQAYKYAVETQSNSTASSGILGQLHTVSNQEGQMLAVVVVVDLELVLLTLFVLYGLVSRTAEARQKEVALAKLHGFRTGAVMAVGLLEPVVVLCLALPLGILLAWVAVKIASPLLLHGAPVFFYGLVLVAALAAFVGGIAATLLGARRIMTRRLVEELQASEPRSSTAARAAVDGAAVALAVAGLVELIFSGVLNGKQPNPIALFAPGLVAVAVAVAGVRLLPLICALAVRGTLNSFWVATALAVRQVVRRPATLRQILVLAVATGLACFAVTGWAVAGTNRLNRANFITGAATVLDVHVPEGVNLVTAVRDADPKGHWAMAAIVSRSPSQDLLGVDAARLARVTDWPTSTSRHSLKQIVRWLTPKVTPPLVVTGSEVRMTVVLPKAVSPEPDLQFSLIDGAGYPGVADFGYLLPGRHTYTASLPQPCRGGCHVTALVPYWTAPSSGAQVANYTLSISSLQQRHTASGWEPVPGRITAPGYWESGGGGAMVLSEQGDPVFSFTDSVQDLTAPQVLAAPLPSTIRGVATNSSQVSDPAQATLEDFDGTTLNVDTQMTTFALPNLGAVGFMLDLPTALRAETSPQSGSENQVWLAPHAPAAVVSRLESQGVRVVGRQVPATLLSRLNQGGLALAFEFFLFAAGAAALLAIGAAVFSIFMAARRRAFELAVLRASGIPRRTLLRSLLGEQLLVLGPGVLLGAVAGIVGAVIALPSVPEFPTITGGPPPQFPLPWLPIAALLVSLVVLLAVASGLASLGTMRMAGYDRLRTEIL